MSFSMAVSVVHARGLCLASSLGNKVAEKTIESSTKRRDASDVTVLTGALLPASMSSEEQWNLRDAVYSIPGVMDTGLRQVIMDRLQELGLPRGDEHEPTPGAFYNLVNRGSGNLIDNYNGRTSPEGGYSFVYFGRTLNMKKMQMATTFIISGHSASMETDTTRLRIARQAVTLLQTTSKPMVMATRLVALVRTCAGHGTAMTEKTQDSIASPSTGQCCTAEIITSL